MPRNPRVQHDGQMFWLGIVMLCLAMIAGMAIDAFGQCSTGRCPVPQSQVQRPIRSLKPHPAICKVYADGSMRVRGRPVASRCVGTGCLIWRGTKKGLVLTVSHLFRDGHDKVWVLFPDGQRFEAEQVQTEEDPDLGALTIPRPEIEPIKISEEDPPSPGDFVTLCGYDGVTGQYRTITGATVGYPSHEATSGGQTPAWDLLFKGTAKEGQSGGPILDAAGNLVAVTWGTGDNLIRGTYAARVGTFIGGSRFIAPWNAATEQVKIKAAAGAYSPPAPLPLPPTDCGPGGCPIATMGSIDSTARQMAQEALSRVSNLEQSVGPGIDRANQLAQEASEKAGKADEAVADLDEGLAEKTKGIIKPWLMGLIKAWGFGGGLIASGIIAVIFFMIRKWAMGIAKRVDWITDKIPGTWDDKLLDPLAYKMGSWMSGQPIPPYAHTPGMDPWGRPYPGQAPQPSPQQPTPVQPTIAELQAQIDALKKG